jgi:hypothetical protein
MPNENFCFCPSHFLCPTFTSFLFSYHLFISVYSLSVYLSVSFIFYFVRKGLKTLDLKVFQFSILCYKITNYKFKYLFLFTNRRSSPSDGPCLHFRRSVRSQGAFLPGSGARSGHPEGLQEHPPTLGGDHSPGGDGPDEPVPGFRTSEAVQMDSKPVQVCLF